MAARNRRRKIAQPGGRAPAPADELARPAAGGWVGLIALGLAARLIVAATTWGSNDVLGFQIFGIQISQLGLFEAYRQNPELNHPPIPALWAAAVYRLAPPAAGDVLAFCFLLKLPGILTEAASAWLVWRAVSARAGRPAGWRAAAAYAWALAPLLVSGYHGNTDTVYAMLSLLAVYLLEDRRRPLAAGLALAAAINVKLIPVLLVPPLLLSLRTRREAAAFLGGLAVGVVPFVPVLAAVGPAFYRNALAYNPKPDRWGLMLPLLWNRELPLDPAADQTVLLYKAYGRYLILALVVGWSALARWRGGTVNGGDGGGRGGGVNRYELAAATYAIFLVFAPGFGAQYVAVVAPLLVAARPAVGFAYATLAGLCVGLLYYLAWDGGIPPGSMILGYVPHSVAVLGLAAWGVLVAYLAAVVRQTVRVRTAAPA